MNHGVLESAKRIAKRRSGTPVNEYSKFFRELAEFGSVSLVGSVGGGTRLLGQRGDLERSVRGRFEHLGGLLRRARVELDQHVYDDAVVGVLVEADVCKELSYACLSEGAVGEQLRCFGA